MNQFEDSVKKSRYIEQEEQQRKKNKMIIDEALEIRKKYPTFKSHIEGGRSKIGLHFHRWEGLMLIPDGYQQMQTFISICTHLWTDKT